MWGLLFMLLCAFIITQSKPGADYVPCKIEDNVCITKIVNVLYKDVLAGIPSLNAEILDPMFHESIQGDLPTIKYKLTNSTIIGYKKCTVTDSTLPIDKYTMRFDLDCPLLTMNGNYEISGNLLTLPIEGKGEYDMECKDYHIVIDTDLQITENAGNYYLSFKNFNVSSQLHGGYINLKNLFNGQKELAEKMLKLMNENWVEASQVLQGPVLNATFKKVINTFNEYLKTKPIDSLIVNFSPK